jgi:hypothetical protein
MSTNNKGCSGWDLFTEFDGFVKEELHGCDTKCCLLFEMLIRDRPFNLKGGYGFLFRSEIFFRTSRVRILIFFVAQSGNFFFQTLTLEYMTKTLNQIIFFFLHQNQNIFFSNIGNQNIF